MDLLTVVSGLTVFFWIALLLDRKRSWPSSQILPPCPPLPPPPFPRSGEPRAAEDGEPPEEVAAIVPARDEAEVLPSTLPALLEQDHSPLRVVLVDDRSQDGTAACARELAEARATRLLVIQAPPAPPGWSGKVHALQRGLEALDENGAAPPWLLLTDADIRHPPDSVRALLAQARLGRFDLVSIMARLSAQTFWERLLIPPFVFFFHLLYPFRRVSAPGARLAAAAGGCILIRREALAAAGGFAAIAGEVIDDVALARAVRRSGGSIWLGLRPEVASLRRYEALGEIWRMVARTAFVQLRFRWDLLAATCLILLLVLVAPPALLALSLALGRPLPAAASALGWLIPALLLLPYTRYHRAPPLYALALPAASLLYLLMTLGSAWSHLRGRGSLWKGRRYGAALREEEGLGRH